MREIRVDDYMTVSCLIAGGLVPLRSRLEHERVVFDFPDDQHQSTNLLTKHLCGDFHPSSRDLCATIQRVKSEIMAARRAGGLR